ncbi:hypothetical protein CCACVL1_27761 [Corchorus capsularis]|uniref:Uncharacterized protein n=1 Tax=Corchorus capsularis TaxID=210143 RepID=A0A1R3G8W7_COCAP|nr:hypothetical protein CCACVL1_27761 [Corchorus capsularis]
MSLKLEDFGFNLHQRRTGNKKENKKDENNVKEERGVLGRAHHKTKKEPFGLED